MKRTNKKGFTITELVIVIAVIGILAAVLIPTFTGVVEDANKSAALQTARNAYTMLTAHDAENNTVPESYNGYAFIVDNKYVVTIDAGELKVVEGKTAANYTLADADKVTVAAAPANVVIYKKITAKAVQA